jgi:hypothetical protein
VGDGGALGQAAVELPRRATGPLLRRGSRFALAAAGVVRGPVRAGRGPAHTRNRKGHGREPAHGLVTLKWGNASGIDRAEGLVVIKVSGVQYETMAAAARQKHFGRKHGPQACYGQP